MNLTKPTILYAEPDELTRRTVAQRLRRRGFDVLEVCSTEAAIDRGSSNHEISLVLLEPSLNGFSGLDVHRRLCRGQFALPAIICTSAKEEFPITRLCGEGIPGHCCLYKPCRFTQLLSAIKRVSSESRISEAKVSRLV